MIIFNQIKAWLWAIGAAVLAALGLFSVTMKKQRDKARDEKEILEATVHAERTRKKIEKEKKEELSRKESEIKERIKNATKPVDLDSLFNNDDW